MTFELTKQFRFEAAHTLSDTTYGEGSRRIHGHSYRAEIAVRGVPDHRSGMILDLGVLERKLLTTKEALDHRFLDEINDLGPATLENLSAWIWDKLSPVANGLCRVTVFRDSCDESCTYYGPEGANQ